MEIIQRINKQKVFVKFRKFVYETIYFFNRLFIVFLWATLYLMVLTLFGITTFSGINWAYCIGLYFFIEEFIRPNIKQTILFREK